MTDPNLIADLIRSGTDPDLVQRVAVELSRLAGDADRLAGEADALEKRRASEAARTSRYRERGGGEIHWALRSAVFDRDGHQCVYCGARLGPFHCDHIIPVSKGGETSLENLATACPTCNASKRDLSLEEWREKCR